MYVRYVIVLFFFFLTWPSSNTKAFMMLTVRLGEKNGHAGAPVNPQRRAISPAANVSTANICPLRYEIIKAVRKNIFYRRNKAVSGAGGTLFRHGECG